MPARHIWIKHLFLVSVVAASSAWAVGARATVAISGLNILPTFDSTITNDPNQGLLVFRNSDQFERLMNLDGVVSECGGDILPSVQSQQIQDGIANAG